jgi:serine/threonine protein kinase
MTLLDFDERYAPGRPIGQGSTSEVFEAVERGTGRRVAVKLLAPEVAASPEACARFEREAEVCAGVRHPNVLSVLDRGTWRGRPFLVTELVEGRPLSDVMAERPRLTAAAALRVLEQICDGLEALHAQGIVHRDLKPANILVGAGDDHPVKITDFGVSKKVAGEVAPATAQGLVVGTPAYMSPEAVAGQGCGPAADLYALAVMVYELTTGEHPFAARNPGDMMRAQLLNEPSIPWTLHPALRKLLERGLEKSPRARFTSAAEFRRALRALEREILGAAGVVAHASGPVHIPHVNRPSGAVRVARQMRRAVLAWGIACAALIGALAMALPALRGAMP